MNHLRKFHYKSLFQISQKTFSKDIFKDRESSMEKSFFNKEDGIIC